MITTDAIQRATYEALEFLGPHWSALSSGFAVYVGNQMYLTQAGQDYLDQSFHAMTLAEAEYRELLQF